MPTATVPVSSESACNDEPVPIGTHRVRQRQSAVRTWQVVDDRRSTRPSDLRATEAVEWRLDGAISRSGHSAVAHASLEAPFGCMAKIDHELLGPCPGELAGRTPNLDRAQHGHLDLVIEAVVAPWTGAYPAAATGPFPIGPVN